MNEHPSRIRFIVTVVGFAALFLLSSISVGAHHGWGGYSDAEFELTGTVESPVSLAGPHATMRVRAEGQVWDVVLAPAARTERAGLKDGMLAVGSTVTLHGHRHRDAKKFEIKTERVRVGEKVFAVYPDRD